MRQRARWRRELDHAEALAANAAISDRNRFWTSCPFCGKMNDSHASVGKPGMPNEGDASICIDCGNVSIYEAGALGHMRKPTPEEQAELDADERVQKVRAAIAQVRK